MTLAKRKPREQDIAAVVVAWLEALGADVYQEVEVPGGVADIVARVGVELWIVEVKTSLSLSLVAQAMERRRLAHRVFVAAPRSRTMREVEPILRETGIGLLVVRVGDFNGHWEYEQPAVDEMVRSARHNRRPVKLAAKLQPEHKTHAKAGAISAAGRWTPFRRTCTKLADVVRRWPGLTIKEAIAKVDHHYASTSSAVSSIPHWIAQGKVPGVRLERRGGTHGALLLYPDEERAA